MDGISGTPAGLLGPAEGLSLLDLPLRPDQLLEPVPPQLRERAEQLRAEQLRMEQSHPGPPVAS